MKKNYYIVFCFICLVYAFVLSSSYSLLIWENLFVLEFIQFPWRFLMVTPLASAVLLILLTSCIKKSFQIIIMLVILILNVFLFYQFFQPKHFIQVNYFNLPYNEWRNNEKTQQFAYFEPGHSLKKNNAEFNNSSIKLLSNNITIFSLAITMFLMIFYYIALTEFLLFAVKLFTGVVKVAKQFLWKCPVDGLIFKSPEEQDEHMQKTGHLIYNDLEDKGKETPKEPDDLSFTKHTGYTPGISSGDVMDNEADLESKKRVEEKTPSKK